jgi:hypothetical protein
MLIPITGHHGTSSEIAQVILSSEFEISKGNNHWLGDGAYFFVEGINSNTIDLAEKWAISEAFDNSSKLYLYLYYSVIESNINVRECEYLDLTCEEGVKVFEYLVDKFFEKLKGTKRKLKTKNYIDGKVLNMARSEEILPLEVVKGNFYIKFTRERIYRLDSRISNCTICMVFNPKKYISSNFIVKEGAVT